MAKNLRELAHALGCAVLIFGGAVFVVFGALGLVMAFFALRP